jgi:hypothetical protein
LFLLRAGDISTRAIEKYPISLQGTEGPVHSAQSKSGIIPNPSSTQKWGEFRSERVFKNDSFIVSLKRNFDTLVWTMQENKSQKFL